MSGGLDLWGCMIGVFLIVAGMVVVIKLLLEFPGLLSWKCIYQEREHEEDIRPYRADLESGRLRGSRVRMYEMHQMNSSKVGSLANSSVEINSKSSVHWSRQQNGGNHHHHHHLQSQGGEKTNGENHENHHQSNSSGGEKKKGSTETVTVASVEAGVGTGLRLVPSSQALARQC